MQKSGTKKLPDSQFSLTMLNWYDGNARVLPWRVGPAQRAAGAKPDPYHVWLSEIMLQQTTVPAVRGYYQRFTLRWPTVEKLAQADDTDVTGEWAGLGYYARARNLLKCARRVSIELAGHFPDTEKDLIRLPGIGPYTAAAIAAIVFDRPATVVDGNVERVMARFFQVTELLPAAKPNLKRLAATLTPQQRPGDYAQAVMDLGATICTPKSPTCGICPCRDSCKARIAGLQNDLPARLPRTKKPTRHGIAYLARRADGAWLLERRPDSGLLGGMLGWPGAPWGEARQEQPPIRANWHDPGLEVRHTFTHFHLRLAIRTVIAPLDAAPTSGSFIKGPDFRRTDLPTVMRKAYDLACDSLSHGMPGN